jgi:hypothetical protein
MRFSSAIKLNNQKKRAVFEQDDQLELARLRKDTRAD